MLNIRLALSVFLLMIVLFNVLTFLIRRQHKTSFTKFVAENPSKSRGTQAWILYPKTCLVLVLMMASGAWLLVAIVLKTF